MSTHDETLHDEMQDTPLVDRAVRQVHDDAPDAEAVRLAADRVWQKLNEEARSGAPAPDAGAALETCDDFRALLPAYVAGDLPEARRLLLEDHSRECVACRRALIAARSGETGRDAAPAPRRRSGRNWLPLAAAAVLMLAASVFGYLLWDGALGGGPVGTVASVEGSLLAVEAGDQAMAPLGGGAVVDSREPVRTAKGSTAVVQLNDGSLVEMAERTQIRVRERRSGTTVFVDRGSIIVEAAPQPRRHNLFVSTDEALVSVTGTIFAVQHGVKGSRVAVVEGEVRVKQGRDETVLHPGQQVSTRASLSAVPVEEQIAWSRNVDQYLDLLSELTALREEIVQRVAPAELRFGSDLAPVVPADTVLYAALPNVSGTLAESYQVFQDRLATSPVLADLWQRQDAEQRAHLEQAIERLRDFGSYLGPEVVIALAVDAAGGAGSEGPVILATVEQPVSFRTWLEQELERLRSEGEDLDGLVLVDDLAALPEGGDSLLVWLGDGLLVATNQADRLRGTVESARSGGSGFPATELGQAVTAAYADGTQWLMAADMARFLAGETERDPEFAATGFDDLERLVVERWDEGERATMSAELAFASERHGIASWLAAPAPMGSLELISADAHLAAAFVVKEPIALLDDLLALDRSGGADGDLGEIEDELGLSLRDDFAAALGGEVAFAIDGPFLPQPSWKVIVEVYDPATLQHAVMTAVAEANQRLQEEGEDGRLVLDSTDAGGHTFYRVASGSATEVHYVYAGGYLVAAPSRALLERTLAERAAGSTLPSSARFRDLLPRDGQAGFSALFFQHLGPLLSPLGGAAARLGSSELTPEQQQTLAELAANAEPTLAWAYGQPDRILVAGNGPGGPLGLGLNALAGFGGIASFADALEAGAEAAAEGE